MHSLVVLCGGRTWRGDSATAWLLEVCLALTLCDWHPSSCFPGAESQRGWVCIHSKSVGPFKWTLLTNWQFLPSPQPLLVFTARSYGALSSWRWDPGQCGLAFVWDRSLPKHPSRFLSTMCDMMGPPVLPPPLRATPCLRAFAPVSLTPPLLPTWMNVASLNPLSSDFHTARFSEGSGGYSF